MQRVNLKEVIQEGRNKQETVLFEVRSGRTWIIASLVPHVLGVKRFQPFSI